MKNKRVILLLVIIIFLLTGCDIKYDLEYKNGKFKESATISEQKVKGVTLPTLEEISKERSHFKITDNEYYKYSYDYNKITNREKINLFFTYDHFLPNESYAYKNCFRIKEFLDKNDTYYIGLNDFSCLLVGDLNVTFRTDKKVYETNADYEDFENGIFKWNDVKKGIKILVSKKENKEEKIINKDFSKRLIIVIVGVILGLVIMTLYLNIRRGKNEG